MEPLTWGALGGVVLFVLTVVGFALKVNKGSVDKIQGMIDSAMATKVAELEGELSSHKVEIDHLKETSLKAGDLMDLKADVRALMERIDGIRELIQQIARANKD